MAHLKPNTTTNGHFVYVCPCVSHICFGCVSPSGAKWLTSTQSYPFDPSVKPSVIFVSRESIWLNWLNCWHTTPQMFILAMPLFLRKIHLVISVLSFVSPTLSHCLWWCFDWQICPSPWVKLSDCQFITDSDPQTTPQHTINCRQSHASLHKVSLFMSFTVGEVLFRGRWS